jgi:hypothetical protein
VRHLRFDPWNATHSLLVGLVCAVLDYAHSTSALIVACSYRGIPALARSTLYAYVDIINLCERPGYCEQLDYLDDLHWKSLSERASAGNNPYLTPLLRSEVFLHGRRLNAASVKAAEKKQVTRLEIGARFELAGLTDEYESGYKLLSAEAHNSPSNARMYFDFLVDPPRLRAWDHDDEGPRLFTLSGSMMVLETVIKATEKVLEYLGHGVAVMADARREFERLLDRVGVDSPSS